MTTTQAGVTISGAVAVALPFISGYRLNEDLVKSLSPAKTALGGAIFLVVGVFVIPGVLVSAFLLFIIGAPLIGLVGNALLAMYFRQPTMKAKEHRFWFLAHSAAFSLLMFFCLWYRTVFISASM